MFRLARLLLIGSLVLALAGPAPTEAGWRARRHETPAKDGHTYPPATVAHLGVCGRARPRAIAISSVSPGICGEFGGCKVDTAEVSMLAGCRQAYAVRFT